MNSENNELTTLTGEHVLLIDDEEVIREIGCEMLESMGITCVTAENGEKGISLFKESKNKFAVVILDVEMPGITGDRVYQILKEINPEIKIVITSGYAKNYLETKYFNEKLDHFIPKPFQLKLLSNLLYSLLTG
jgi:CheY-like chemotaxis protein